MNGVKLRKVVFEQQFIGFDMNIPLRRCTPLNYNQLCRILTDGQTDWNISYPRYDMDWFEAIDQNNSRAFVLESKNWLVEHIKGTLLMFTRRFDPRFGGYIINLNADDYAGKCNFKEYPYLNSSLIFMDKKYPLQVPNNPTFPLLKTIRSAIEVYYKILQDEYTYRIHQFVLRNASN